MDFRSNQNERAPRQRPVAFVTVSAASATRREIRPRLRSGEGVRHQTPAGRRPIPELCHLRNSGAIGVLTTDAVPGAPDPQWRGGSQQQRRRIEGLIPGLQIAVACLLERHRADSVPGPLTNIFGRCLGEVKRFSMISTEFVRFKVDKINEKQPASAGYNAPLQAEARPIPGIHSGFKSLFHNDLKNAP
jgi:hypothetical protein